MKNSNPTPRLKSSPVPILFIPFNSSENRCKYCKNEYSRTKSRQKFCKNCLFDYVNNLTDNNIYLDVIYENVDRCIEHKDSGTQNIQKWCNGCSEISHFNQIVTKDNRNLHYTSNYLQNFYSYHETKCKLCEYEKVCDSLCPICYFISSEWIESTLVKNPILIVYLPWWDYSSECIACERDLKYKSDCQKWCSYCCIIHTGCRYCLTTNIIFGITEQSKCRKCKRVIDIDVTDIEYYNLENFTSRIFINDNIVNWVNNIKQGSNLVDSVYRYMWRKGSKQNPDNHSYPIKENGQIRFISFSNNMDRCNYCGFSYSSTIFFEQKYCKYCLYLYYKNLGSDKNVCLDVHINNTSNSHCTEHESKNIESYTQNIQEWCMNCSEILYFKQIVTKYSFDMNYYYERQNEIIKFEKDCTLCGQQNLLINTEFSLCSNCYSISFELIESTLTEKTILILYLSLWYNNEQCIVCKHILNDIPSEASDNCQKWCSNCFTIYTGCRYCLTTNIVFGLTNKSECKKCKRRSFITIGTKNIMENFFVSAKINANNHDQIINYVNNKSPNLLKLYGFISKLNYIDLKYISYSNLESNENSSIPVIFIPFDNSENICYQCRNKYSVTLLFEQKYCEYCLYWYIKFAKFKTQNTVDIHDKPRNLEVYTKIIQEWCINCPEISYFKQIITQYLFEMEEQIKVIQSENCNLCGNLINQQISFMCLNCYSVSSGYIESNLIKKKIPVLYLPWWDAFSNCIVCRQKLKYESDCQKWCSYCFIIYNGCRYCLTTNIIFGFTNQSQCIKCKRVEPISIHNIGEFLYSTIYTDEIANYMKNVDKDNNPLNIYSFIKNKLGIFKNIKMIEYSKTEDFERIAEGGFGIIYKAAWKINSSDKKIVAVKKFLKSQNIGKYFINELEPFIQYHNRFEHIIKYYGITQDPETKDHMIIMQYADGGDLHNYLQINFENITWEDKLTILLEISRGVDCIHKENFIHRDLHSGNILLINGKWHIGDLGLSRPANVTSSNNEIYGVIPYVAPEIFNGNTFSKESDIYSLGMIMWELTTGCKPFANFDHGIGLIYKIIDGKRPEITDDTPKCFSNLMKKCWDSDPLKRPRIEAIRKAIALWKYAIKNILHPHINLEDVDKFNQAERLRLIKINELNPNRFAVNSHPGAIYNSRLLHSLISSLSSISSPSSTSFNTKQEHISKELEFDINNAKRSSLSELNSTTQNSVNNIQCPNAIYTSRPLNEMLPIKQEYSSREIELDINDAQWSPLPDVNSTVQNSLYKIAEIKTETHNEKLVLQDDLEAGLQLKSQDQIICRDGSFRTQRTHTTSINNTNLYFGRKDSRMGSTTYNKDPVKEFDKLNKEFSDRIKEISGNTEGFKGKGKEGETGNYTLNTNKKRSAQSQGARKFSDTVSDKE